MSSILSQDNIQKSRLGEMIAHWAVHTPDALAMLAPNRKSLTYRQLQTHLAAVARQLRLLGVGRCDRVALVMPNSPEMVVAFLAVADSAVCAPLNPAYRAAEYEFYLTDLQAAALLIPAGIDSTARAVAQAK